MVRQEVTGDGETRGNIKAKVSVENFDQVKKLFLLHVKNTVLMDEIPLTMS